MNMHRFFYISLTLLFASSSIAQVDQTIQQAQMQTRSAADTTGKIWTKGGVFSINFSQVQLINWAGGGVSSASGNGLFNAFANRKKGKHSWDNSIALAYGLMAQEDRKTFKTDDRLELNSKYGYEIGKSLYFSTLFQFRSQFADGFKSVDDSIAISRFLAPAYVLLGVGFDYKPNDNFSLFVSPAMARFVIVADQTLADAGAFGVEAALRDTAGTIVTPGENLDFQFGAYLNAQYKKDIAKNVNFFTRLELFSNYLREPQNVDVIWETMWTFKVNDWLAANLNTILLYDHDIDITRTEDNVVKTGPATQFKEVFGMGLTYKF